MIRMQKESVIRYIPTSDKTVERLKKQAKTLQRSGAGKHSDLHNRVAKQAGYDPWHHVFKCNETGAAVTRGDAAGCLVLAERGVQ